MHWVHCRIAEFSVVLRRFRHQIAVQRERPTHSRLSLGSIEMSILNDLRTRLARRAAYNRTVRELRGMPRDIARDLGLFVEDAELNAYRAVYGN